MGLCFAVVLHQSMPDSTQHLLSVVFAQVVPMGPLGQAVSTAVSARTELSAIMSVEPVLARLAGQELFVKKVLFLPFTWKQPFLTDHSRARFLMGRA